MKNKKEPDIRLTELFMAKPLNDFSRCFYGTIKRLRDPDGIPYVFGKIKVMDGFIMAQGKDQWELGERLDQLVKMVLDFDLNASAGKKTVIAGTPIFHN
jgi:hypothetical protein